MARRLYKTNADYVTIAIAPGLIMALVTSLVFFLLLVFYRGEWQERLQYIMTLFIFAAVLIARIAMDEGRERAMVFSVFLGGAAGFVVTRFSDLGLFANFGLLGLIWWSADRLTWDCTLIDDHENASGEGLLQTVGLDEPSAVPRAASRDADVDVEPLSVTGGEAAAHPPRTWWRNVWDHFHKRRSPGVWIVYFSLAALPIFGFGQKFIAGDEARDAAFRYLFIYVASALGLLLTTCFLGLRRYLRQRRVEMPDKMAAVWVATGCALIVGLLIFCTVLPRRNPVMDIAASAPPVQFGSPKDLVASWLGWGDEGVKDDQAGTAEKEAQEQSGGESGERKTESGKQDGGGESNSSGGQQQGGQQQGGQQQGGQQQGGQQQGGQQQGGQQQGGQQQGGQQQGGQQQGGQQQGGQQQGGQQQGGQQQGGQQQGGQQQGGQQQGGQQQGGQQQGGQQQGGQQQGGQQQGGQQQGGQQQDGQQQDGQQQGGQQQGGQQQGGQQQGGPQQGGQQQGGEQQGGQQQGGQQQGGQQQGGQQQGGQQQGGQQQGGQQPGGQSPGGQGGEKQGGQRQDGRDSPAPPPRQSSSQSQRPQPQPRPAQRPSPPQQSSSSGSWFRSLLGWLAPLLKIAFYAIVVLAGIWAFRKFKGELLAGFRELFKDLRDFWDRLLGRKKPLAAATSEAPRDPQPSYRPFSAYPDPFASTAAGRHTPEQLVRYSFEAFEAWARERGCPRHPEQTPHEFAQEIGTRNTAVSRPARDLADLYSRLAYAPGPLPASSVEHLKQLWKALRS